MSTLASLRLRKARRFASLALRNRATQQPAVDPDGGPPVSLTSHGERIATVHLALESIAAGTLRPRRLILWLDDLDAVADPHPGLRRLIRRGVEVRATENFRPHTKYYPYVQSIDMHRMPLVTADDDLVYPRTWLERLCAAHATDPTTNTAHRSREVTFTEGTIRPYEAWPEVVRGPSSPRNLATGTWGHVIVPRMLDALRGGADDFRSAAPAADDLWLHRVAVEQGVAAKVSGSFGHPDFLHLPDGGSALSSDNVGGSGNDRQIASAWDGALLRTMLDSPVPANAYL
ncbi:hypothetical protein ACTJKO_07130 [Curtobacterium sp. 22159]|uniref:hypothetical protein n=1 Tax=Curtobacterium sp. 22159 TaxID=3453882 RepID=UPI003F8798FF